MIIGITGAIGAGKGAVVEYLVRKYGFKHFSARNFIAREVERRNLPLNRDTMVETANSLREQHHPGFIIEQLYEEAVRSTGNAVIESIRTLGEIEFLRKQPSFYLLAIDADPKLRYERILERKSATDNISFEKFLADEKREMASSDQTKQNIGACIDLADFKIKNDGTMEELEESVDQIMTVIKK